MKRFLFKQLAMVLAIALLVPLMGVADDTLPQDTQQEMTLQTETISTVATVTDSSLEDYPDSTVNESISSVGEESTEYGDDAIYDNEDIISASDIEPDMDETGETDWVDLVVDEDEDNDASDTDTTDNNQVIPFDQTVEIGEVSIRVTAGVDSFPEGSTVWAEECIDDSIIQACGEALELNNGYTHYLYRIEVHDASGNAILPYAVSSQPIVHVAGLKITDDIRVVCYDPTAEGVLTIDTVIDEDIIEFVFTDSAIYDIIIHDDLDRETDKESDEESDDEPSEDNSAEETDTTGEQSENEDESNSEVEKPESDDGESKSTTVDDSEESDDLELLLIDEEDVLSEEEQSSQDAAYSVVSSPSVEYTQSWSEFAAALSKLTQEYDGSNSIEGGSSQFEAGLSEGVNNAYSSARLIVWVEGDLQDIPEEYNVRAIIRDPDNHYFLQFDNPTDAKECSDYLLTLPNVSYVEPDGIVYGDNTADNSASEKNYHSWGVKATHADEYAEYLKEKGGSTSVVVAVVDSGIYSGNQLFSGRLVSGYDFVSNDNDPEPSTDHGTHVAGTVAECTAGLSIKIMPIRVLEDDGTGKASGSDSIISQGIRYAADSGAKVINLSLGGKHNSRYLEEAVQYAINKGVTVVAAAGNDSTDVNDHCPAHISDCITVTAVDSEMNFADDFSNYGSAVDISAPGVYIESASGSGFAYKSGTSMAAPHVSAAAAMLLYEYPSYSPSQVSTRLKSNATDLGATGWDEYFGAGFLNLRPFVNPAGIPIDQNHFPDVTFRDYIKKAFDKDKNSTLSAAEIAAVEEMSLSNNSIRSIEGIAYFTSLETLRCEVGQLKSLNVSGCVKLKELVCRFNQMENLNVSGCTALTYLNCLKNQLKSINTTGCTALRHLTCNNNQLKNLNLTDCNNLGFLECSNNQLTSLNVSNCSKLIELYCDNNQLVNLDVSGCTELSGLTCHNNKLSSLNISVCTKLGLLGCSNNQLTSLNVSSCSTWLHSLSCYSNNLKNLDVSNNTYLKSLNCFENHLKTLNVDNLAWLTSLNCSYNDLITLNTSNLPSLVTLYCSYNQLSALSIQDSPSLMWIDCRHNRLSDLSISSTILRQLLCNDNSLTSINIEGCPEIAKNVNSTYYRLSADKKIVSYEKYVDRREDESDTSKTYLACDSYVSIIGGNPVPPYSEPAPAPAPAPASVPTTVSTAPAPTPVEPAVTISSAPSSVKAKAKKAKVTVSWKKIKTNKKGKALLKTIKSIEVQYSTDPTLTTNVVSKTVGKKKTKITLKLQKKTQYYFRVRYVGTDGGVSNWSAVKKVKTKK